MKVLLVEDDRKIASAVRRGLQAEGFTVEIANDGLDGQWMALEGGFDQSLAVGRHPDVHRDGSDPVGELGLELVEALPASGADDDPRADTEQFLGGGPPDPGACPGDNHDLVLK